MEECQAALAAARTVLIHDGARPEPPARGGTGHGAGSGSVRCHMNGQLIPRERPGGARRCGNDTIGVRHSPVHGLFRLVQSLFVVLFMACSLSCSLVLFLAGTAFDHDESRRDGPPSCSGSTGETGSRRVHTAGGDNIFIGGVARAGRRGLARKAVEHDHEQKWPRPCGSRAADLPQLPLWQPGANLEGLGADRNGPGAPRRRLIRAPLRHRALRPPRFLKLRPPG